MLAQAKDEFTHTLFGCKIATDAFQPFIFLHQPCMIRTNRIVFTLFVILKGNQQCIFVSTCLFKTVQKGSGEITEGSKRPFDLFHHLPTESSIAICGSRHAAASQSIANPAGFLSLF
jgi:hypothetical protein